MADLKNAIREMLRRGMTEAQVKENLSEMGVADVDMVFQQATESLYSVASAPPKEPADAQMSSMMPPQEEDTQQPAEQAEPAAPVAQFDSGETNQRLQEAIALLKSLTDLNKRILDTNREILLRLKQ